MTLPHTVGPQAPEDFEREPEWDDVMDYVRATTANLEPGA